MKQTFLSLLLIFWSLASTAQVSGDIDMYAANTFTPSKSIHTSYFDGIDSRYSFTSKQHARLSNGIAASADNSDQSFADPVLIRIHAGGGQVIFGSEVWSADIYYSGGTEYSNSSAIAGTTNDALYQSERWGNHSYSIPVPNGSYTVKLHFAEIFHTTTGKRVFNVNVENGQGTLSNYDIVQQAGAKTAKVEQFTSINITDGMVNVSFSNIVDNAKISAIEVISNAPAVNTAPTVSSIITDKILAFNTTSLSVPLSSVFADNSGFASLALSVSGNTNTVLVTAASVISGNLNLTLAAGQTGTSLIKVKATDAEGLFVEDEFSVTVQPYVNLAPTISSSIPDQSVNINTASKAVSLSGVFADDNGAAALTLTVTGNSNSALITAASITSGILNLTIAGGQSGTSLIKVRATDIQGLFVEDEFSMQVINNITPATLIRINAGGGQIIFGSETWAADQYSSGGSTYSNSNAIASTTNDAIYQSERWGNHSYIIPVPNGSYTVRLLFAEIFHTTTGKRVFNVNVENGQGNLNNYDIVQQAGANTAKIEQFTNINVTDGFVNISLTNIVDNAKISAIEVISNAPVVNTPPVVSAIITDKSLAFNTTSLSVPLSPVFTDNNGFSALTLSVSGNTNTSLVTATSIVSGTLNLTLAAGQSGTALIKVKATDAEGLFVEDEFSVTVQAYVNTAPSVVTPIADQTLAFNTTSFNMPLSAIFADNNGFASLALSVSGNTNPGLVTAASVTSGTLNLTLSPGQTGTSLIKLKATDTEGLFVEDEFNLTVQPQVNLAPTVSNSIPDQSANINAASKSVSLAGIFADDNGTAALTLSVSGNTNTSLITAASITSGILNLTIANNQTGTALIKVKATDVQGLFVEDEFSIQVVDNTTPSTIIRINAGGGQIIFGSETWIADQYNSGGSAYSNSNAIASTTNDALYQSERWGNHSYAIPVPNGSYTIKLHFAEIFHTATGKRVFNVNVENGQGSLSNYDIVQAAGANTAKVEQFTNINVSDGLVNISFTNIVDNAKISGIEIISSGSSNQPPVANAGSDQSVTLPTNSVSVNGTNSTDAGGSIIGYNWSKISGPNEFSILSPNAASSEINGLVAGTYTFRLTVTDNQNATAFDDVVITVNAGNIVTTTTIIPLLSSWKYSDNGSNLGTSWRQSSYNDQSWSSGNAQLGYGDGDEATIVSYGTSTSNKYITTYFRKTVTINNPAAYTNFSLGVKRDDGVVIYVNGTEVYRNNMPTGTVRYTTLASSAASDDGGTIQTATLASSVFADGTNVVAVEIHQNVASSTDLSFDLRLIANANGGGSAALITRNPYLQMASSNAITIRWKTDVATDSKISAGTSLGNYTLSQTNSTSTTDHEVRITGLTADTKYYYTVGTGSQVLQSGADQFFTTAPNSSASRKMAFAVFGDCGRNENGFQSGTLSAYQNFVGNNPADLLLLLGDNAYDFGSEAEYNNNFFNVYGNNILKNHVTFPAPGNHDYDNESQQSRSHAYYNVFSAPSNGESGGIASGTEAFYSYNWGNVHFLSLDSYGTEGDNSRLYDTLGPQVTWMKNDLAANNKLWTVVYFHHPPYSMGSHSSDAEYELTKIRENLIRILERFGVDLVLTGHSHDYERSYPLRNHFGSESSFDVGTHALYNSSGKYDGSSNSCVYLTSSTNVNNKGTIYVVAGSSGADGGVQNGYPHNAMPFSVDDGGMFYFTVENNRLDGKFIRRDGVIDDQFTVMKDAGKTTTVNITQGSSTTLTASWVGSYQWSNGATTKSIVVNPNTNASYSVSDPSGCINDVFNVNVNANTRKINSAIEETEREIKAADWKVYPIPVKKGQQLTINGDNKMPYSLQVVAKDGRTILTTTARGTYQLDTKNMIPGIYYIRIQTNNKPLLKKIMVMD